MRALKRFGQHWLDDPAILDRIVAAARLTPDDRVLEIGPGLGSLTARLLAQVPVSAIEIDRRAIAHLHNQFGGRPDFTLLEGDVLQLPLPSEPNVVVANIPYNISGPILARLTGSIGEAHRQFRTIVLLLQKELAERIAAPPGGRDYGALSVRLQYLAECELVFAVPRTAFRPPPEVDSAVIRLVPRPFPVVAHDPAHLEQLLQRAFATRRKMLRNCLKGWVDLDRLDATLEDLQIHPQSRAENLSVEQFVLLSNRLIQSKGP